MVDLINALHTIQNICEVKGACKECPMYDINDSGCYLLHNAPPSWDIKDVSEFKRVFNKKEKK